MTLRTLVPLLLCTATLAACASPRWTYSAPPGIPEARLKADTAACKEESGIERLKEDREILEQRCMMAYGYTVKEGP